MKVEKDLSKFRLWFGRVRTVAAWIVIPAFLSMFIAHYYLTRNYPTPFPSWIGIEPPPGFYRALNLRNYSLLVVVAASLISLPRWQSIVGLISTVLFLWLWGSL